MRITILGAGAMGSSLARPLRERGHAVRLWATPYDLAVLESLRKGKAHPSLGVTLPAGVELFPPDALAESLREVECVLLASNTRGVLPVMQQCLPYLPEGVPLVSLAKGFVEQEGQVLLVADALRVLGASKAPRILALAGPSIAAEVAQGLWTAVCLGGDDAEAVKQIAGAMTTSTFAVLPFADTIGMEICAAFKNLYSIALAWTEGKENASLRNLKAILYLQVLEELKRLVKAGGGDPWTVMGLPGLGDFIATASGGRNGALGRLLGAGKSLKQALAAMSRHGSVTVEGLDAAHLAQGYTDQLAGISREDLPLLAAISEVLNHELTVDHAIAQLIPRLGLFRGSADA